MLRAFLVDDERLAIERLTRLLDNTGLVEVVGSATDPEEALAQLGAIDVDVLFLDIQMPGLTGFDLVARLDREIPVVFTTAYDRYALEAFDVNSVDYLLKRWNRSGSHAASTSCSDSSARRVRTCAISPARSRRSSRRGRKLERLASRIGERTTILDVPRITHFVAKDKLTFACLNGAEHVVDHSLSELEARLDPRRFIRVHRSAIVNAAFVQELHPSVDGGLTVRLKDAQGTELPVARDRVARLKASLGI
jgi:two-component system LytT family response regulator